MGQISKSITSIFIISLVIIIAVSFSVWQRLKTPVLGGKFELTSHANVFKFNAVAKPLNLIYFGYTKCPDVCPMSLSFAAQAFQKLSADELEKVQFIFISVDHEHETAENTLKYARQFHDSFLGTTGDEKSVDAVVKLFGAGYFLEKNPKSYIGYSITHTDRIFFTNSKGIVLDSIPNPRDSETIYKKIKENL